MRNLTKKQKQLIVNYILGVNEKGEKINVELNHFDYDREDSSLTDELEKLNDTEVLWSESNRFANDFIFSGDKEKFIVEHKLKKPFNLKTYNY